MIHNHCLSRTHNDSQPLAQHSTTWLATTVWGSGCESWCGILSQWWWIMVSDEWASGCESWCAMLSQWLWIMVSYTEPVVVNHGVLWCAGGCESWCVMLSQLLWIVVCYSEQVVVNHSELCCEKWLWIMMRYQYVEHSGWESWCALLSSVVVNCDVLCLEKWLWIMMWYRYAEPSGWESWCFMPNQWLWIAHHDSQPLAQHNSLWFTNTGSV
jgi:hypothetical protein